LTAPHRTALAPSRWLADIRAAEPRFLALGLLLVAAMAPTGFAAALEVRQFHGIDVWEKALKFEFALAIYLLTLAFYARWLPAGLSSRRWYRIYSGAVVAAITAEMIWIGGASAMAVASHFNETPLGAIIYPLMGGAAVVLTSASMVFAVQTWRNRSSGLPPVLREALVTGLALVLPLTLITAGTMSAMGGHWVGGAENDTGGLMLMGWARDGGDLRVAHFFATHAMHFIPAAGFVSALFLGDDARLPLRLVTVAFLALVAFTFIQALAGHPFFPMLG
jgi:hypothetical protein